MKKLFFLFILFVLLLGGHSTLRAQNVLDGIYPKEHVLNRKPIPYTHVREADVMWAKKVGELLT